MKFMVETILEVAKTTPVRGPEQGTVQVEEEFEREENNGNQRKFKCCEN